MKSKRRLLNSLTGSATLHAVLVMSLTAASAFSATITWDGGGVGGTDLATAANWLGDVLPSISTPDTATWDGSVTGALALTYGTGLGGAAGNLGLNLNLTSTQTSALSIDSATNTAVRINNVTLDSGSGAFTLGDGTGTGATGFAITLGGAGGQTQTWTNQSTNAATINADVRFGLGGASNHALAFAGAGNWAVNALLTPSNTANLSLLKTGAGQLTLSGGGSLNNATAPLVTAYGGTFVATLKEGITKITAGTYAANNGEVVVGGLDTGVGTNTQLVMDAGSITGVSWLSVGRGNGTGTGSSDVILKNTASISATNFSGGFNAGNAATMPKGSITLNNTSSLVLSATGAFQVGESPGSNIAITLNDGSSASMTGAGSATNRYLGNTGATGSLTLNGTSTFTAGASIFNVGYQTGTGTLNINGGTFTNGAEVRVGASNAGGPFASGSGTINMTGGTATVASLTLSRSNNAADTINGAVNVSGGTFNSTGNTLVGWQGNGNASISVTGGTFNANSQLQIGVLNTTHGSVTVNGGVLKSEGDLIVGESGTGTGSLTLTTGTVNVATATKRWMLIGHNGATAGNVTVNGGTLNLNTNTDIRFTTLAAANGTNGFTLNGGTVQGWAGNQTGGLSTISVVDLNQGATGAANNTFNLNGGTLAISQIITNNNNGTAAFNFNGGTLKATTTTANFVDLGGANQHAYVLTGGAVIDSNSFNVTIPEALLTGGGGGGLTKTGAGTLTLGGVNTYTGPTTVNAGTLAIPGSISNTSSLTINGSGAKVTQSTTAAFAAPVTLTQGTYETSAQIASLTVGNNAANTVTPGAVPAFPMIIDNALTFNGAATVNLRANGSLMDQFIDGGASMVLTTPGDGPTNGQVTLNVSNIGAWSGGTDYPLISYSSFSGDISDFTLGTVSGLSPRQTPSLVVSGNSIALHITGDSLRWTGTKSADWTTAAVGSPYNWMLPSTSAGTDFLTGDVVVFDDNAGSNTSVNIAQNVTPGSTLFDNSLDYTLSSTGAFGIAGGSVIKNNSGKVTLSTNNTYTGTTTINGGTLEISGTGSIASSSSITNNSNLNFDLSGTPNVYANPITGTGSISKLGAGTLTLAGNNTFTGSFTLNAGLLNLNNAGALGAGPGIITINGGTLDNTSGATVFMTPNKAQTWNSDISFIGTNSLYMSNGAVTLPATRTVNVQANIFGCGAVGDAGSGYGLVKTGAGKLVLNGGNIGGNLDIQNGIVAINQDFLGAAPIGTGILQNDGAVGTKWTFWNGSTDVTSNVLIRNNDGSNLRQLGIVKRGAGTLTLTNNSNIATSNLSVDSGKLVLNNSGTYGSRNEDGSTVTNLTALVGNTNGANGLLEINGATVNYNNRSTAGTEAFRGTLTVGNVTGGAGALKLTSGSLTTNMQLALGWTGTAFGAMTQTGGTSTVGGFLVLGLGTSQGVLNFSGGTFNHNGPLTNGTNSGGIGVMNLTGTAAYNCNNTSTFGFWIAEGGSGTLNISDSAALTLASTGSGIVLGQLATGVGTLNLRGGTVTTKSLGKGAGAGVLNFNGGTLAANVASTTFLTGLTSAYVHSGGGTLNNGGNAITIGQALLAPTGNGVSASGLTVSGGGYIDTPIVTITGDGTGATAVANIDGSGNLTGITITNPGTGYTTPPTFALVGGGVGNTGAIGGSASLVPNSSGGITFSGAALTTLSGVNTYTGNSTVNSGTTLVLAGGSALQFAPGANHVSNKITGSGTVALYGNFNIDTGNAAIANGNSWTLVDVSTRTFDPLLFNIPGFTQAADVWTKVDGANTWTFTEATGVLSLSVAAPSGYATWSSTNAPTGTANDDYDNDGVSNGVEYVLGGSSTTNDLGKLPAITTSGGNVLFTFKRKQTSETPDTSVKIDVGTTLGTWPTSYAVPNDPVAASPGVTVVDNGDGTDSITLTIPQAPDATKFARLVVTVN